MSTEKQIRPFGTWPSPLSASGVASAGTRYGLCRFEGSDIYWSELRPTEGPRAVIVAQSADGTVKDRLPAPFSARSRVHEYGGGEFAVQDGQICFVNDRDQDLYLTQDGKAPERLTDAPEWRFADMNLVASSSLVVSVGEKHSVTDGHGSGHNLPQNAIVAIPYGNGSVTDPNMILAGRDFYASPRANQDGTRLAWLAWDLPDMPWEAAELWVADLGPDGQISNPEHIAGGTADIGTGAGAFQPEWGEDGRLYFVADHQNWGNLHVADQSGIRVIRADKAEYGRPLWQFGMASFALMASNIVASCWRDGRLEVLLLDGAGELIKPIETDLVRLDSLAASVDGFAILGGSDDATPGLHRFSPDGTIEQAGQNQIGCNKILGSGDVSPATMLKITTATGPLHALYYPPANSSFAGPEGKTPPLVVAAHGGPTAMAKRGLDLEHQYWTTRGFAFLDVDYRGSFGYGRTYVTALNGAWGVLDPQDAIEAARFVAKKGLADANAMVIMGGSAGGLTVLNALATSDTFAAGASSYGVADLTSLAQETHKFEAGYLYALMGAPANDDIALEKIFAERSPLTHADKITSPMIFLQGLEDAVVPPNQSQSMVASLRQRGVPVAYLEFEGEGHGFRKPETVIAALQATHGFFARILGLKPDETLPKLAIDNLPD